MQFKMRQMEVFRAVIIGGSLTNAARLLNISQPAVSRMIAHIEDSLDVELFQRAKGRLIPTTEALLLLDEVEKVHSAAIQANEFVENLAREMSGVLRVGVSACLSPLVAESLIPSFMQTYPRITIDFFTMLLADMPVALLSDRIDLAVSVMPLENANIRTTEIAARRMVLLVPGDHELADRTSVTLAEIAAHPLIVHSEDMALGRMVATAFGDGGIDYETRCIIHHSRDACDLVAAGAGAAIIDPFTATIARSRGLSTISIAEDIVTRPSINHVLLREPRSEVAYLMDHGARRLADAIPQER